MSVSKRPRTAGASGGASASEADSARRGLITLNKLDYVLDPDLSVCVSRAYKRHNFHNTSYTSSQRAVCILNSGADYIDPSTSYFIASIRNNSGKPISFGRIGSLANIVDRIVISSRSGEEVERIEKANLLNAILDYTTMDREWRKSIGSVAGCELDGRISLAGPYLLGGVSTAVAADRDVANVAGSTQGVIPTMMLAQGDKALEDSKTLNAAAVDFGERCTESGASANVYTKPRSSFILKDNEVAEFAIPISCISPLFRTFDRLLPSHLMSGMRFELDFAKIYDAFIARVKESTAVNTTDTFAIEQPRFMLDSYTLTDSVQRALNEVAASSGLEIPFKSFYHNTATVPDGSKVVNLELRKAVSRALKVLTVVRRPYVPSTETHQTGRTDVYLHTDWVGDAVHRYQCRVGSLYFPQQPILPSQPGVGAGAETYINTMRNLGKLNTPSNPGSYTWNDFRTCPIYVTDFERSTTQKLSGIPVNASRVVQVQIETNPDDDHKVRSHAVDTWLCYQRLLRVWVNSVDVAE